MSETIAWLLVGAVVCVLLAGFAAAVDAALARISPVRALELLDQGSPGAARLVRVTADPAPYFNLALLIRVAGELAAAVMVTMACVHRFGLTLGGAALAVGVMIVVSYVVVGVCPRTLGRQHAPRVAAVGAAVLSPLGVVLGPLTRLLIMVGNALTPGRGFREGPFATEAELRALIDIAEQNSEIEAAERRMVHSVFELGDTLVREVMVPRTDMVSIERGKTLRQAVALALRSGFSRIPVTGQNADDVVGIAYLKDLVRRMNDFRGGDDGEPVDSVMRPATYVPDSKHADELLRDMQSQRIHMAIVIDEYGGTAGLVTIEDILEEIVGEITDEYDTGRPEIEWLADPGDLAEGARVSARLSLDQLGELFERDLEDEDVDTVGGLLAKQLGMVPIQGSTVDHAGLRLVAESTEGRRRRIATVLVRAVPDEPEEDGRAAQHDEAARDGAADDGSGAPEAVEGAEGGLEGSAARGGASGRRGADAGKAAERGNGVPPAEVGSSKGGARTAPGA